MPSAKKLMEKAPSTIEGLAKEIKALTDYKNTIDNRIQNLHNLKAAARNKKMVKLIAGTYWDIECQHVPFTLNYISKHNMEQRKHCAPLIDRIKDPFEDMVKDTIYPHGRTPLNDEVIICCDDSHVYIRPDPEIYHDFKYKEDTYENEFELFKTVLAFAKANKMIILNEDIGVHIKRTQDKLKEMEELNVRMNQFMTACGV